MTQAQECAHRFATRPEQRQREEVNEALNLLDAQLRACRDLPGMVEWLDRIAARLEDLGAA